MHTANLTTWPASLARAPRATCSRPPDNVGQRHHKARLTDAEVEQLRRMHEDEGISLRKLAAIFEVPWQTVQSICCGRTR